MVAPGEATHPEPAAAAHRKMERSTSMASYLRSAIGRASGLAASVGTESEEEKTTSNQLNHEDREDRSLTASLTDDRDDDEKGSWNGEVSPTPNQGNPPFIVKIEQDSEVVNEASTDCDHSADTDKEPALEQRRRSWTSFDVVLQLGSDGLGVNVGVAPLPSNLPHSSYNEATTAIAITSFRRCALGVAGPAEASGLLQVGDILASIDAEPVHSLASVQAIISTAKSRNQQFLMLRVLRYSSTDHEQPSVTMGAPRSVSKQPICDVLAAHPDISMLIRELVVKNQHLEEQVLVSRLKQDEQRIQLEQLHTLYAKTQLDGSTSSLLPLPKTLPRPVFSRRAASESNGKGSSLSHAAARFLGSSAASYDVEFAVNAERERLTQAFDQRLDAELSRLRLQHAQELAEAKRAVEKKISMLEYGLQQLLLSSDSSDHSPHIQALRHRVLHRHARPDCLLCLLSVECEQLQDEATASDAAWRQRVCDIIHAHKLSMQDTTTIDPPPPPPPQQEQ